MENLQLSNGLCIRPSRPSDRGFIENLYRSSRNDLRMADADPDYIETIIEQQLNAQTVGYGDAFPNAMYFIVELHGQCIGRITIDFGGAEIRVVDIVLISQIRGKGYGSAIIMALQQAAGKARTPLALSVLRTNLAAKKLYLQLGFRVEEVTTPYERLIWYPTKEHMYT